MQKGSGPLRKKEVIAEYNLLLLQTGRLTPSEGRARGTQDQAFQLLPPQEGQPPVPYDLSLALSSGE